MILLADALQRTVPEEIKRWYWYVKQVALLKGLDPELAHERQTNPASRTRRDYQAWNWNVAYKDARLERVRYPRRIRKPFISTPSCRQYCIEVEVAQMV